MDRGAWRATVRGVTTGGLALLLPWREQLVLLHVGSQHKRSACMCLLSHVQLCATPWTVARQAPLSMGFSRQEYWSGLPCPPPADLPDPGIEPTSLMSPALAGGFFTTGATRLVED